MSDEELIKAIRQGDRTAEEELIRRYYPPVFHFCLSRCGNRQTAEDLAQETFLRLFSALADYSEKGRFRAFLFLIAKRLCINESKKTPVYSLDGEEQLIDRQDEMGQMEDRDALRQLLGELPPEQREAIFLRFGAQLSYRDIARVTGCNLRTVQSRVMYGLKHMRKRLSHE